MPISDDEIVEAMAQAMFAVPCETDERNPSYRTIARAALTVARRHIEAQARAKALDDAASLVEQSFDNPDTIPYVGTSIVSKKTLKRISEAILKLKDA